MAVISVCVFHKTDSSRSDLELTLEKYTEMHRFVHHRERLQCTQYDLVSQYNNDLYLAQVGLIFLKCSAPKRRIWESLLALPE